MGIDCSLVSFLFSFRERSERMLVIQRRSGVDHAILVEVATTGLDAEASDDEPDGCCPAQQPPSPASDPSTPAALLSTRAPSKTSKARSRPAESGLAIAVARGTPSCRSSLVP